MSAIGKCCEGDTVVNAFHKHLASFFWIPRLRLSIVTVFKFRCILDVIFFVEVEKKEFECSILVADEDRCVAVTMFLGTREKTRWMSALFVLDQFIQCQI